MPSRYEAFWRNTAFAVVGSSADAPFPELSYTALRNRPGTTVYAVDAGAETIAGDPAYPDLSALPAPVQAVVLEVPKEQTRAWVEKVADAGIRQLWIHMGRDTPEALELASARGLDLCTGTCAVQYLQGGFPHNLHKLLRKLAGRW